MATVNLKQSYSGLNESLIHLFDESGVRRSATVPYISGQKMDEHVTSVGQAASQNGGLTANLVLSAHHSGGKGFGSGDGETTLHPAERLRQTLIPKNDERAKAAIDAAQKHISNLKFLLGDDEPTVQAAQGQLDLTKKTSGAGMSLYDLGVLLVNIMHAPTQAVARAHDQTKDGGMHPRRRGPAQEESQDAQEGGQGAPGEAQPPAEGFEAQAPGQAQGAAPTSPGQV